MDDDVFAGVKALAQALTVRGPLFFELWFRRADVADRQMQPSHAATLNLGAEIASALVAKPDFSKMSTRDQFAHALANPKRG
jgi:hypothetical protein